MIVGVMEAYKFCEWWVKNMENKKQGSDCEEGG